MTIVDRAHAYLVIGAGPSGLTALKNFHAAGIPVEGCDAEPDVGGVWNYAQRSGSVYESTHMISSKRLSQFRDWPMPAEFPEYPSHAQALEYLRSYAAEFQLRPLIRFSTRVERITKSGEQWLVRFEDGSASRYRGVVIANGHHCTPNMPAIPGQFTGEMLHARDYKKAAQLRGQRVLVIGAGNSGCDIAVEAAQHAQACSLSMRRGYHFIPKFLRGYPSDRWGELLLSWRVPLFLRRWVLARGTKTGLGDPQDFGLPRPDHRFLESHPIINSQLLYYVGHGRIQPRPAVQEFSGRTVIFRDGTQQEFDLVIAATGYQLDFPFIERELLNWQDGMPRLFLHAFHPREDRLFVAGMIQPDSGQWGITDWQTRLMAMLVQTQAHDPNSVDWFRQLKQGPPPRLSNGIRYLDSPRHQLEVEHWSYRRRLEQLCARCAATSRTSVSATAAKNSTR